MSEKVGGGYSWLFCLLDPGPSGLPPGLNPAAPAPHSAYLHGGGTERSRRASDTRHVLQDRQGWDHEFYPKPDNKYECPICLFVLRDPIQTMCGHRFCCECIQQWLRYSFSWLLECPVRWC